MDQMQWLQMPQVKRDTSMQDMGQKILQAALNQKSQNNAALAAQPQAGQTMPGGAMNITPATLQQSGGIGMLGKMFKPGGLFGGSVQPAGVAPMTSENALY